MILRFFKPEDAEECAHLFYQTIHSVNSQDYTEEQLNAWAPPVTQEVIERFRNFLSRNISYVVVENNLIIGFSDLDRSGYYNCLYVHNEFQKQGVASILYKQLEKDAIEIGLSELTSEVSITAKSFFQLKGFKLFKEQEKLHNGIVLKNFIMKKQLK